MRRGFTLIELLVVIAIIAILAAILFPVFARAREKARQSACSSNLKQLALSMLMYVQDYDERFPGAYCALNPTGTGRWHTVVEPYIKNLQLFICPSEPDWVYVATSTRAGAYGYNGYGTTGSNGLGWRYASASGPAPSQWAPKLGQVMQPASMIMLGECATYYYEIRGYGGAGSTYGPSLRHNEGSNVAHVDGHVKWYMGTAIAAGDDRAAGWLDPTDAQWTFWVRNPASSSGY